MKKHLLPLLATAALTLPAALAQKPGDSVTTDVFAKLDWIQGEAPKSWEPGKLYVLECWATWCGPCIAAIPHVDALYDKYSSKGLRVIGVDVWEDGKDKVAEFVKKKGEGMSYPVAYTGKGGAFETEWLKPANVRGIPHTFLVMDGKVLAGIHPMKLTDELVEKLLKGGDEAKAAISGLNESQARSEKEGAAQLAFSTASRKGDAEAMAAALEDLRKANPESPYLPLMTSDLAIVRADWGALDNQLKSLPEGNMRPMLVSSVVSKLTSTENVPQEILKKLVPVFEETPMLAKSPVSLVLGSRLCWQAGEKDKALAQAKSALETVRANPGRMKPEPFEKFLAAVEGGAMPSNKEFMDWAVASSKEAAAEGPAAGKAAVPMAPVTPRS